MITELSKYPKLQAFVKSSQEFDQIGSRVTVDPPPMDTDEDWLILAGDIDQDVKRAQDLGCKLDYTYTSAEEFDFYAVRFENINIVMVEDYDHYRGYIRARDVCQRLNLTDKLDRIAVHDAVLDRTSACVRQEVPNHATEDSLGFWA